MSYLFRTVPLRSRTSGALGALARRRRFAGLGIVPVNLKVLAQGSPTGTTITSPIVVGSSPTPWWERGGTTPIIATLPGAPSNPSVGQTYVSGSLTYTWNGTQWVATSQTSAATQPGTALPSTSGTPSTTIGTIPGTNVPVGTPTTEAYIDSSGNIWTYDASTGQWINTTAGAGLPGTGSTAPSVNVATPASPDYWSSLLTWLSGSDIGNTVGLGAIPNWAFVLGGGLLVVKAMRKR